MTLAQMRLIRVISLCALVLHFSVGLARSHNGDPIRGAKLVSRLGCKTCHTVRGEGGSGETRGPELAGVYGTTVEMESGEKVAVTEDNLREAITDPDARTVKDFPAGKMPKRFAHMPEKDLADIVAYIKILSGAEAGPQVTTAETRTAEEKVKPAAGPVHLSPPSVWIWIFIGFCAGLLASLSIYFMSRNISWRWVMVIVSIAGLGLGGGMVWTDNTPRGSDREFQIVARQFAYDPPVIRVDKGDRVTLRLKSKDVLHGFYLDGYGINAMIRPDETVRLTFIANKEGKFGFRCSHTCGVFHPFMTGYLIVAPNHLFPASIGLGLGLALAAFLYVAKKEE